MSMESEIRSTFGLPEDDKDKVTKCQTIMTLFDLSVEDLNVKWESYVMTQAQDPDMQITTENLDKLQEYIQQSIRKKNQQNLNASAQKAKVRPGMRANFNMANLPTMGSPSTPNSSAKKRRLETPLSKSMGKPMSSPLASTVPSTPETPLGSKQVESGSILESLNPDVVDSVELGTLEVNNAIKITAHFEDSKYNFRPMGQKLLDAADFLDEQLENFTRVILKHLNLTEADLVPPCDASQEQIFAVGRIVADSAINESTTRMDQNSIFLECTRQVSFGERVPLYLNKLTDFSFFPGQIVALRGRNPDGSAFIVDEVVPFPYLGTHVSSQSEIQEYHKNLEGHPLKVVTTVGPYTRNDSLELSSLAAFVDRMNNEVHPHAIIMLGPFVDITHPHVSNGSISISEKPEPQTLDELFKLTFTPILREIDSKTQVILVPSMRDASAKHASYPQIGFDRKQLGLPRNFKCFPNPSSFQINDSLFGVSNNDIVKDLTEVTSSSVSIKNRFDRVAAHIMEQRRYYPLFPGGTKNRTIPGTNDVEHICGADLDVPYLGLTELPDATPDVLIMPSEMRYFARVVKNVIAVNPGVFMRPSGTGTYAVSYIKSPDLEGNDLEEADVQDSDEKFYVHNVWKRARVDIVKT